MWPPPTCRPCCVTQPGCSDNPRSRTATEPKTDEATRRLWNDVAMDEQLKTELQRIADRLQTLQVRL